MNVHFNLSPMYKYDMPTEIYEVDESEDGLKFEKFEYSDVPISQILKKLEFKTADLVIYADSCSFKKGSPSSTVMPKVFVH